MRSINSSSSSSSSSTSRLSEFLRSIPLATRLILLLNILLFLYSFYDEWALTNYSICPSLVWRHGQVGRLYSNAFFHVNFLHILMNMFSVFYISALIEQKTGTAPLLGFILLATPLIGITYVLLYYTYESMAGNHVWDYSGCAVGFSGVIFAMSMIEVRLSIIAGQRMRSIFGMFSVPAMLYPWILLVILSLALPNVSFGGHLAGILIGFLWTKGIFLPLTVPRKYWLKWERADNPILGRFHSWESYINMPLNDALETGYFEFIRNGTCDGSMCTIPVVAGSKLRGFYEKCVPYCCQFLPFSSEASGYDQLEQNSALRNRPGGHVLGNSERPAASSVAVPSSSYGRSPFEPINSMSSQVSQSTSQWVDEGDLEAAHSSASAPALQLDSLRSSNSSSGYTPPPVRQPPGGNPTDQIL